MDKMHTRSQQIEKILELEKQGYMWNREKSILAAGVVYIKGKDLYFFGLNGEILHNPDGITITC